MSLIATFLKNNVCFLTADLLWSSREELNREFPLPFSGRISATKLLGGKLLANPVNLMQKLYIIDETLCIVFSGNYVEIKLFLEDLTKFWSYSKENQNRVRLFEFLSSFDLYTNFTQSSFLLQFAEKVDEGLPMLFDIRHGKIYEIQHPVYGLIHATGSGSNGFLEIIEKKTIYDFPENDGTQMYVLISHLSLLAHLLTRERFSLETIADAWGGGFETAVFQNDRFVRMDKIAYVICNGKYLDDAVTKTEHLLLPNLLMYYEYYKGVLQITSFDFTQRPEVEYADTSINLTYRKFLSNKFIVPGISQDEVVIEEIEKMSNSFSTARLAAGFILTRPENKYLFPSFFDDFGNYVVRFDETENIVTLTLAMHWVELYSKKLE
ncbi:MAG TPA: hypothetical protein VK666_09995 [Chryseolinea sp.]|nr:hypothetical protein [Chryseolinea sp.]